MGAAPRANTIGMPTLIKPSKIQINVTGIISRPHKNPQNDPWNDQPSKLVQNRAMLGNERILLCWLAGDQKGYVFQKLLQ